jgi:protein required for attachment to host cells
MYMSKNSDLAAGGVTWVLVADAHRAEIYARHKRHSIPEIVHCLEEKQARAREQDLVADEPGRAFDRKGQGRHAMEPDHREKENVRTAFARRIAQVLESGRSSGRFDRLVMVAAPAMLGELRAQLDKPTTACIVAEFSKTLTGQTPETIANFIDANS